jgi:putative transposase
MRYAVITRHRDEFPVRLMCRVLEVTPSGYYAARTRPPSWHAIIDDVLLAHVHLAHDASGQTYGAPRVHDELIALGLPTSRKRVARLMRQEGLVARPRAPWRLTTTDANHADPIAPNLLARQFTVSTTFNRVWVADLTYLPTREGVLYLATVLDLGSRRCVGWAMQDTMDVTLPLRALQQAIATRRPAPGLLHHSDRGSQYASKTYQAVLADAGMRPSMSRTGNCYDNAVAESFFSTLEFELVMRHDWHTRGEAQRAVFRYITTWYNPRRRHSSLGSISPADYEVQFAQAA